MIKSKSELSSIKPETFIRNTLTVFTGNAVAFLIPIALYPILSRLFTPADYALYGLYIGIFSFLEIGSCGRYDFAIVMPSKNEDAANLLSGGLIFSIFYSAFVLILVVFFRTDISTQLNNAALASWLWLLPLTLTLVSVSKLFSAWLIRQKQFKAASINKASQKIGESLTQLGFGSTRIENGLIFGDLTGRVLNAGFSLYQGLRSGFKFANVQAKEIRANLKNYSEFPKYSVVPSMLNALGGMLPIFIVSSYYSTESSGSFNFSRIILSVPFALISAGIAQVLMQQVSERRHRSEGIHKEILSLAWKLAALAATGVVILYIAGPQLFVIVFGEKWRLAGEYTTLLAFSYAVSFVVSPFTILPGLLGRLKLSSYWQIAYFIVTCSLWFLKDVPIGVFLTALVVIDVVMYTIYAAIIYLSIRTYEKTLSK